MSRWDQPPEETMTFSKVQDFSPEVTSTPSAVSVMLSIGVLV